MGLTNKSDVCQKRKGVLEMKYVITL